MSRKNNWRRDWESEAGPSSRTYNHPRQLKGKAIGMWYAGGSRKKRYFDLDNEVVKQSREEKKIKRAEKNIKRSENKFKKPLGSIFISQKKKENINQLLSETGSIYPASFYDKTNTYEHLEETCFKHEFLQHITGNIISKLQSDLIVSFQCKNEDQDKQFLDELEKKATSRSYQKMQDIRKRLPSMEKRDRILEYVDNHQVTVISGETGCGKTTQVAQFILDDHIKKGKGSECRIICTQPRRISAISVAERVARERDEQLGCSVGYQIRLEKTMPRDRGSILFCTTGVLLKYMESNPSLSEVSHLILDEIHERDVISDFLITTLKEVANYRNDIKIILMSATLNSEAFSKYYNDAPHINIPGFTYPVEEYFLEDVLEYTCYKFKDDTRPVWQRAKEGVNRKNREWFEFMEPHFRQLEAEGRYDSEVIKELRNPTSEKLDLDLIVELITKICKKDNDEGAILVFVPGLGDIQVICRNLQYRLLPAWKYRIIPLHSQLPSVDQKQIFDVPPKGVRKIIVSTNIAETSITIDDVTTVIDGGFIKISNFDPESGIETLNAEWVSQANAAQRKGRAGRVKPGVCFHLISRIRYELLDKFIKPEVLRKRLENVILRLKMLQLGDAEPFLARLMDPPESKTVQTSVALLQRLGALSHAEGLTPLGFHMAKLPLEAQCSKMLILAALFNCVDPILSIVASLGFKDGFQVSMTNTQEADRKRVELSNGTNSDHLCMHYAIRGFEDEPDPRAFCRKYYLSGYILRMLVDFRKDFARQLFEMKFISSENPRSPLNNCNSENVGLIKAIISAGLYPNVAIVNKVFRGRSRVSSISNEKLGFHPKSVLYYLRSFPSPLIVYHLKLKTKVDSIHDGTLVFPLPIVFFGDKFRIHNSNDNDDSFKGLSINDKLRFLCTESTSSTIQKLRDRLNQILEWKISHPGFVDWMHVTPEVKILRVIMDLITSEDSENLDLSDFEDT